MGRLFLLSLSTLYWHSTDVHLQTFMSLTEPTVRKDPSMKLNKSKSVGEEVILQYNGSMTNATQVNWKKDKDSFFAHNFLNNSTRSNNTLNRLKVDPATYTKLRIHNVETVDTGIYSLIITAPQCGHWNIEWNLTITDKPTEGRLIVLHTMTS